MTSSQLQEQCEQGQLSSKSDDPPAHFEDGVTRLKHAMEISIRQVRELEVHLKAGSETIEAVNRKLSSKLSRPSGTQENDSCGTPVSASA